MAFSFLFFTFLDKPSSAPGASLINALPIFLTALFLLIFLAKLKAFLNAFLKPLLPCLTRHLRPLGAALCLYGLSSCTFFGNSVRVAHLYLARNVLPFGNVTLFGFCLLTITIRSLRAILPE